MPQSLTLTAYVVKLLLRSELSGVPVGSTASTGKENQQKAVGIEQLADHGLCGYTVGDFGD
jgi:hypothetical protein